jgi:Fe-S-cluster containining protein
METKEIDRIFFRDGYRLAHRYLETEVNGTAIREAVQNLYEAVDGLLEAFLLRSAAENRPAECRNGCDWCCHQAVFAVTHELHYLRDHVQKRFSGMRQGIFAERAEEKTQLTLHKTLEEQLQVRAPCPFLEEGSCAVYGARPMACRIYLSYSAAACRKAHDEPGGESIPELFEFPLRAGRMLNQGFVAHLKQIGMPSTELPLEQGYSALVALDWTFESWIRQRPPPG